MLEMVLVDPYVNDKYEVAVTQSAKDSMGQYPGVSSHNKLACCANEMYSSSSR